MKDSKKRHTILITGAAGYVGAMLIDQFSKRPDVGAIIGIDKEEKPEFLDHVENLIWFTANLSDPAWKQQAGKYIPDVVIHSAWQIRELYGDKKLQWKWNIEGSQHVFDFAFDTPSVDRLVYFSSASVYGAYPENTIEHRFNEEEPLQEDEYLYGVEKRIAEEKLQRSYTQVRQRGSKTRVFIIRPAAITGPRGRFMRIRFGLQSALSGQLKGGSFSYRLVTLLVSFVPATKRWCRQFVHEDDITDFTAVLSFDDISGEYEAFNLTPPGPVVRAKDMAQAVGKRTLRVHPLVVRVAFFFFWHLTRGKIPTSRGGWKFYSYPVVMDGSKATRHTNFSYRCESKEAFTSTDGRYKEASKNFA